MLTPGLVVRTMVLYHKFHTHLGQPDVKHDMSFLVKNLLKLEKRSK